MLTSSLGVLVGSGIVFIVIAAILSRHLGSIPVFNKLVLSPPTEGEAGTVTVAADGKTIMAQAESVQLGDWGTTESPLRPAGKVKFGDDYIDVVADGLYVEAGRQVRVTQIRGNRIVVREVERQA
jgi:membrane-bound serine protease (ClpP class)